MARSGFLIIALFFTLATGMAQVNYDFRQVDSITYANTLSGNWDEVIRLGKYALDQDMDYFYLRLRLGISYFSKNNFLAAIKHLEKASRMNPEDGLTRNYLYNAYLNSGQQENAALLAGSMNTRMREISGIDRRRGFSTIYFETGPEFSNNLTMNELNKPAPERPLMHQDLYGNSYYTHLGTRLYVHPRISIYAGISNLLVSKKASLRYTTSRVDSVVYYDWGFAKYLTTGPKAETETYDYTLTQYSAYMNVNILLGRGWSLVPAFHYINVDTRRIDIEDMTSLVKDTAYYITELDSTAFTLYALARYEIQATKLTLDNMVFSLALHKKISVADLGFFGSWSNLNEVEQVQFGISCTYYPLGNLNFYGTSILKEHIEEGKTNLLFSQMIGVKVSHFLWAEGFGVFGPMRGTNESDAFVVYNLSDQVHLKAGIDLIFVISPAVQFSVRYQYLQKQAYRTVSGSGTLNAYVIQELDYTNQSIIGGLKWIF